ncbi:MAG TPA: hypothetical protein VEA69_04165 [Tepidisphaeraceae bacterium]|nr:hypothetical protein [Tepidisphaeraceae bacterium]
MRFLAPTIVAALWLPGLCGCAFPRFFPGQVAGIRVVDPATGADLPYAVVRYQVVPVKGDFMRPVTPNVAEDDAAMAAPDAPGEHDLGVERTADGTFRPRTTVRWAVRYPVIVGPLVAFTGPDYSVRIEAWAPGRRSASVDYYAGDRLTEMPLHWSPRRDDAPRDPTTVVRIMPDGAVRFALHPLNPAP